MTSVSDIKAGLLWVMQQITPANGYTNTVESTHTRGYYDGQWIDDKSDRLYPKILVVVDSGEIEQLPSYQYHRTLRFSVFIFVRQLQNTTPVTTMTESFIADVEKAVGIHSSLNGTVNNARIVGFLTDGGVLAPEGCVILYVETLST